MPIDTAPRLADLKAAAVGLAGLAVRTPLLTAPVLERFPTRLNHSDGAVLVKFKE